MSIGTVVRTKSGDVRGTVREVSGPWWRVDWEDGKTTWSDGRLLTAHGHIVATSEQHDALGAERDRYREALEDIAGRTELPIPDWEFAGRPEDREAAMRKVARDAIEMRQEEHRGD